MSQFADQVIFHYENSSALVAFYWQETCLKRIQANVASLASARLLQQGPSTAIAPNAGAQGTGTALNLGRKIDFAMRALEVAHATHEKAESLHSFVLLPIAIAGFGRSMSKFQHCTSPVSHWRQAA